VTAGSGPVSVPRALGGDRHTTARLHVLAGLVVVGLVAAVLARRPEVAALVAPLLAVVLVGSARHRWPELAVTVRPERSRAVDGDVVDLLVEVDASRAVPWLDVELVLPPELAPLDDAARALVALPEAGTRVIRFPVRVHGWGVCSPEQVRVVARDRFGLFARSWVISGHAPLRVYPGEGHLRALLAPQRTARTLGAHLAAERGEGCEFADVRPYRPGDRLRAVNWRVSARRGERWVNERHPERAADLVLLLDAGTDVGTGDDTTLRRSVRAAMALAESHVGAHDRLGLCSLGATLRWLPPRLGQHQLYRVVDSLLDSQAAAREGLGGTGVAGALAGLGRHASLPLRGLAPGTAVVALTPLVDRRVVDVLGDLRQRGFDVVVVEPAPEAVLSPPADDAAWVARRLWHVERAAVRHELSAVGVPCVVWDDERPLGAALDQLSRRRSPGALVGAGGAPG
jgi:uncharacterized protein (DUF58 family)